ncbi:hypothetical protein [Ensifer adhaerens]|uniref:hypothetical protein n=1 Tax=Ensifer adhaerens TaxID=106592 RepID=UPI00098F2D0A|nr:hypothetical protein [Ensifer adhaerens]
MSNALALPFFRSLRLAGEHSRGEISDSQYCVRLVAIFAAAQGKRLSEAELVEMDEGKLLTLATEVVGQFDLSAELADG